MEVFTAIEISVGSALGYFEQQRIRVSLGSDFTLWTGKPSNESMSPTGSSRLSTSNHFLRSSGPSVPETQQVHRRPSACASSIMSTTTWNEVAPSL
jgi:hypothetical protein